MSKILQGHGPGGRRDRTLPVKRRKTHKNHFFFLVKNKNYNKKMKKMNISSSYAIILGETNFLSREFPRSGSKAKDGEKRRTMASYALQRHLSKLLNT